MRAPQKLAKADAAYFRKWYRDPRHRVSTKAAAKRKVALVLAVAEYYLERPVRSVLDVGCGEGNWYPLLAALRPGLRYLGIDSSKYAVRRHGKRRNLQLGDFDQLGEAGLEGPYDLIICSDVLYYLSRATLTRGLRALVPHLGGVAFLEAYDRREPLEGDTAHLQRLSADAYRRIFRQCGLIACGSHCYVGAELAHRVTALERGG
ncbi:MAG: class I SAM-dependent methyltransferase [Verrucomicrobia bacterium]|nr:class I SAM-dependent methyltransferase [Verrucomicrobiota bacterium]